MQSQAAVPGGRLPPGTGPLASSTSRWAGSGTSGGPGQGHAAAVAARILAVGAEEPGILAGAVTDIGDLGQAQFLTLVDIGRAGQGEQHQRGRPGAPGTRLGVAVAEGDEPRSEERRVG